MAAKLQACKVYNPKNVETFWVRGYVFREITIVNLVFGRPGFDSRSLQTLRASNFDAPWPTRSKTNFFERSHQYLLGTRLNMLFSPTLPAKAVLYWSVILNNANQCEAMRDNAKQCQVL